jgi:hypothetical protein
VISYCTQLHSSAFISVFRGAGVLLIGSPLLGLTRCRGQTVAGSLLLSLGLKFFAVRVTLWSPSAGVPWFTCRILIHLSPLIRLEE